MTAYLIKVDTYKPYSGYLYLFRNSDKKLIGEKPILVYFKDEASPCQYRTDTKIIDYNQDGYLDLIIYQKEECITVPHSTFNYNYRTLLWDNEIGNFVLESEWKEQNKGQIENTNLKIQYEVDKNIFSASSFTIALF